MRLGLLCLLGLLCAGGKGLALVAAGYPGCD